MPRDDASARNLLNFEKPMEPSSKAGSISCMTCLSRSERMTSSRLIMRSTALLTSCHGSWLPPVSSVVLVSPVRLV